MAGDYDKKVDALRKRLLKLEAEARKKAKDSDKKHNQHKRVVKRDMSKHNKDMAKHKKDIQKHKADLKRMAEKVKRLEKKKARAQLKPTATFKQQMGKLNRSVDSLLSLLTEAHSEIGGEKLQIDKEIIEKLDHLLEQNEKVAQGILAVAEMMKGESAPADPFAETAVEAPPEQSDIFAQPANNININVGAPDSMQNPLDATQPDAQSDFSPQEASPDSAPDLMPDMSQPGSPPDLAPDMSQPGTPDVAPEMPDMSQPGSPPDLMPDMSQPGAPPDVAQPGSDLMPDMAQPGSIPDAPAAPPDMTAGAPPDMNQPPAMASNNINVPPPTMPANFGAPDVQIPDVNQDMQNPPDMKPPAQPQQDIFNAPVQAPPQQGGLFGDNKEENIQPIEPAEMQASSPPGVQPFDAPINLSSEPGGLPPLGPPPAPGVDPIQTNTAPAPPQKGKLQLKPFENG